MPRSIAVEYRAAAQAHAAQSARNRELILRYPDIAERLREPPLKSCDPRTWSGFIPGPLATEDARGRVPINTSAVRAQLLAILNAAAERADAEGRRPARIDDTGRAAA